MSTGEATGAMPSGDDRPHEPSQLSPEDESGDTSPEFHESGPDGVRTATEQLFADPTDEKLPMWPALRQLFSGEYVALAGVGITSFLGGMCEAALLVLIANLALSIGGEATVDQQASLFGLAGQPVMILFVVALGLTLVRLMLQYISARLGARTTARLTQSLRNGTFQDYVSASWEVQSAIPEAAVQDLLQRHLAKTQAAVISVGMVLYTAFMILALVISAFIVDPIASGLIVIFGSVLFLCLRPMTIRAKRLGQLQMRQGVVYGVQSREAIDMSLEIRSFGVSESVTERLDRATRKEISSLYRSQLMARMIASIYTSAAILILLVALIAMDLFLNRPLAAIGAIVVVLIRALNQTSGLQTSYHGLGDLIPYIYRLFDERKYFRDSRPPSGAERLEQVGALAFTGVSYSYGQRSNALSELSFAVESGEAIGIIGPSGSGKSTLIQLLLRLRYAESGAYTVDGIPAEDFDDDSWFDLVSFVPQDSRTFDDTIANNIAFFRPGVTQEQVEAAARRAHVHDEIMAMPDGYQTVLGSRGGSLSGGQRQRVCIARALVTNPSMLVLDEPTSALDMRSESLVHETLAELKGRVTLFVIAHRLSTLNTCDRIMVLREGRLQAFGTRAELERDDEFYREAIALSQVRS